MLLHDLVSAAAATDPERAAVIGPDGSARTFADFDRDIRAVAAWVCAHSSPGDRVAVIGDNSLAYAQLYYGVPRARRPLTLVNQRLDPAEQLAQLVRTEPAILVADRTYLERHTELASVGSLRHVAVTESAPWQQAPAALNEPDPEPGDAAWLVFTSGSTGSPKGVVHSHQSIVAAVHGSVEGRSVPPRGVYLLPFPMCHIAGYNMLVQHAVGATVVLTAQFRADAFAATINRFGVTSCSLAPTMLHALLTHLEKTHATLPTLRSIAYGSGAIPAELLRRALDRLDVEFHQGYGMTETGGNVAFLGPAEHRAGAAGDPEILSAAGRPHSGVAVRIADDGEILVRGPQVTARYWPDQPATGPDGWLPTGDVGRLDAEGRLFVVDRRKDIVVTGGENVSSREVEDVLTGHPAVEVAAVVGVPDEYWGEAVCAVVVPAAGSTPSAEELIDYVRHRLSAFKRPRHVLFVPVLPLTTNGKVAKDKIRAIAQAAVSDVS
ncbi:AMP-binding protein [Mycolicibacterium sp. F2034L]|uniref:AMP-binding protein n=1 Tax=Mycolicibacterium sp. F2034L TaxID=2926422 RepID=UPI001FF641D6|nr:AMP-binding protein [Mycolicibacterium sp. F2034L]MCK0173959.1 AMP-binding protein [Mycolicibacterium sp. F2034L]